MLQGDPIVLNSRGIFIQATSFFFKPIILNCTKPDTGMIFSKDTCLETLFSHCLLEIQLFFFSLLLKGLSSTKTSCDPLVMSSNYCPESFNIATNISELFFKKFERKMKSNCSFSVNFVSLFLFVSFRWKCCFRSFSGIPLIFRESQ